MRQLDALGSIPHALAGVALLLAAAWSLGGFFVRSPVGDVGLRLKSIWPPIVVGLNLIAWAGVVLGQFGVLAGGSSVWLLAGCAMLGIARAWRWWRKRSDWAIKRQSACRKLSHRGRGLTFGLAAITLGPALCPPTGWDELVYHHELPRRWLAEGRPAFYPDLAYSGFPSLGEILFWLVAPLEHVITPRLIVWICWMGGLTLFYDLLRRRLASLSAGALMLAFAASSTLLMISANCYVESLLLMNVAAMLWFIDTPQRMAGGRCERRPPAIVLGVLVGGAAAVKLTGLSLLPLPCFWYIAEGWSDRTRLPSAARSLATFLLATLIFGMPFYIRPWLATGNPFYPYFCAWFTDGPARVAMSRFHHALGDAFGVRSLIGLVECPLLLAFREDLFDGAFGWQLLIFLTLSILALATVARCRRRYFALWPASASVWLFGFWFLTAQQARFAVPAMATLVLLTAAGLQRLRRTKRKGALALLLAATLVSAPWGTTGHYIGSWFTAVGLIHRIDYVNVETDGQYVPLLQALYEHTPADAKLMLLFEHRGFYVPRTYTIGTPLFQETGFTPPEQFAETTEILQLLAQEGITHVVVTKQLAGPERVASLNELLAPFSHALAQCSQEGRWRLIWESEKYLLYQVH